MERRKDMKDMQTEKAMKEFKYGVNSMQNMRNAILG